MSDDSDIIGEFAKKFSDKPYGGMLENWTVQWTEEDNTDLPFIIWGNIHGEPYRRFGEGNWMHTSQVLEINEEDGYIVTRNTVYALGNKAKPLTPEEKKKREEDLEKLAEDLKKLGGCFF